MKGEAGGAVNAILVRLQVGPASQRALCSRTPMRRAFPSHHTSAQDALPPACASQLALAPPHAACHRDWRWRSGVPILAALRISAGKSDMYKRINKRGKYIRAIFRRVLVCSDSVGTEGCDKGGPRRRQGPGRFAGRQEQTGWLVPADAARAQARVRCVGAVCPWVRPVPPCT